MEASRNSRENTAICVACWMVCFEAITPFYPSFAFIPVILNYTRPARLRYDLARKDPRVIDEVDWQALIDIRHFNFKRRFKCSAVPKSQISILPDRQCRPGTVEEQTELMVRD
jgi:hypothetical protein